MTIVAQTNMLISALGLPISCRVDHRVSKKMLVENGAPTRADKRLINEAVEEIQWLAALKPNTVGIAEYRDDGRDYLEVIVLCITMRGALIGDGTGVVGAAPYTRPADITRLAELVHRAVPYPVLLLLAAPQSLYLSLAHKRWAQNMSGKVVLDGEPEISDVAVGLTVEHPFAQAMALSQQPQASLLTLYQGWMDCLTAWQAAQYTGVFLAPDSPLQAAVRRDALRKCQRLEQEHARLTVLAVKEKQLAKQVDLNLALKRISAELLSVREQL